MPARRKKLKRKAADKSARRLGRVTRCTHAVIDAMCDAIATGAYLETAAEHTGIIRRRFHEWLRKGADDEKEGIESIYRTMRERTSVAMAEAELANLETLRLHAEGYAVDVEKTVITQTPDGREIERKTTHERRFKRDWSAAAWRLERQHPERWARRDTNILVDATEVAKAAAQIYFPAKDELPEAVVQRRRQLAVVQQAVNVAAKVGTVSLPALQPPGDKPGNGTNGGNGAKK